MIQRFFTITLLVASSFQVTFANSIKKEEELLSDLKTEYRDKYYDSCGEANSKEIEAIKAALNVHDYPMLPVSHLWRVDEDKKVDLRAHQDAPHKVKLYTFGYREPGKLAYIVQEGHRGRASFKTIHSYSPTRQAVWTGPRSQKTFITHKGITYDAGHCIDHADTPDERLRLYNPVHSTDHPANLIPEPKGGWGGIIRSHLVKDIRKQNGAYSQYVYYGADAKLKYADAPFRAAIPSGVLFFEHSSASSSKASGIVSGWQVDWNDDGIQYASTGRGPRTRLRHHQISQNILPGLAYFEGFSLTLKDDFSQSLDPLSRYYLQTLADQEMVPRYSPYLAQYDLAEGRFEYGGYWINRIIQQSRKLLDNDYVFKLPDAKPISALIQNAYAFEEFEMDDQIIENLNRVLTETGCEKVSPKKPKQEGPLVKSEEVEDKTVTENVVIAPLAISISTAKGWPCPKIENIEPETPLILNFSNNGQPITSGKKGVATRRFNKFIARNQQKISNFSSVEIRGELDLVSDKLKSTIQGLFPSSN